jgi:hypothetical protein
LHPDAYLQHPYREWVVPLGFHSPWIVAGAAAGIYCLRRWGSRIHRLASLAFIPQIMTVLLFYFMTHRYSVDFMPLMIYLTGFFLFYLANSQMPHEKTKIFFKMYILLCVWSVGATILSTLSWEAFYNWSAPGEWVGQLRRAIKAVNDFF